MLLNFFRYSALILLCTSYSASAEIHKWTDENGKVHYSQVPPNQIKTETIAAPSKPAVDPEEATENLNERLETDRIADQEKYLADQNAANLKKKQEAQEHNCKAATQNLKLYQSYGRVRVKETDGSYTRLSEEDRQQRISNMKEKITEFCDGPPVTLTEAEKSKAILTEEAPAQSATEQEPTATE